uniref:RING-type domain-containing protein n=1 Tax=Clytia hemisphaerica TaxID=252671 RepID=A0A7M5WIR9_9CNID
KILFFLLQCGICLTSMKGDGPQRPFVLHCGPVFCKSCITLWFDQWCHCPACKSPGRRTTPLYVDTSFLEAIERMTATIKQLMKEKEQLEIQIEELFMQIVCLDADKEELEKKQMKN